jgi:hypothetical protein
LPEIEDVGGVGEDEESYREVLTKSGFLSS